MRVKLLLAVAFLVLVSLSLLPNTSPVSLAATEAATQAANPDCKPADLIKTANALKTTGDSAKDMIALIALQSQINVMGAACNGLKFKGKSNQTVGPFTLPAGTYRATAISNGFLAVNLTPLDGSCADVQGSDLIFNFEQGAGNQGLDSIIKSDGCKAVLVANNVTAPWSISFASLDDSSDAATPSQ